MKDLHERCAKIIMSWELNFGKQLNQKRKVNDLESFAREMFEAGRMSVLSPPMSWCHTGPCQTNCTCTAALAANVSEDKGNG